MVGLFRSHHTKCSRWAGAPTKSSYISISGPWSQKDTSLASDANVDACARSNEAHSPTYGVVDTREINKEITLLTQPRAIPLFGADSTQWTVEGIPVPTCILLDPR